MAEDEKAEAKPDHEAPPGAEASARWTGGAKPLGYTATAKWLVLRKKEKPSAEIFSVSYVAEGGDRERPVAFVFNGGPGASSAYLHMGAVGPQRVAFPSDGTLPTLPPQLVQNESSWLAFADLVFVDPVGTGFSRIIEPDKKGEQQGKQEGAPQPGGDEKPDPNEYFGQKRDLESLCEFIARWLSENDRWGSPVFIAGESYGGYRVGRLVRMLQEETGIGLNGAILISPALELTGLDGDDYGVVQWVDLCRRWRPAPHSTVARAPSRPGRRSPRCSQVPRSLRAATTRRSSSGAPRSACPSGSARSGGSPIWSVSRPSSSRGRRAASRPVVYARELLRDQQKVVGLYDVSITRSIPSPTGRSTRRRIRPSPESGPPIPRRSTGSSARRSASAPTASTAC